jgi:hypothetical protein
MGEYLVKGTLPTYGTTCVADEQLVFPATTSSNQISGNTTRRRHFDPRQPSGKQSFVV